MTNNEFNGNEFRALLRKGIGLRTQKEFADKTGLAPATINRMLNDPDAPCPKVKTLEVLSSVMSNVTLTELLHSCGYEAESVQDRAARLESDVSDFLAFGKTDYGISVFQNMDGFVKKLGSFLEGRYESATVSVEIPSSPVAPCEPADEAVELRILWKYDEYVCSSVLTLYYITGVSGKVIIVNRDGMRTSFKKRDEISAAKKLMSAIFGDEQGKVSTVQIGTGFEVTGTPSGFADFLEEHANTFCDSDENALLYRRFVESSDEAVFADYEDLGGSTGCCAVIADIMRKESGTEYLYYPADEAVPEEQRNACVMCRNPYNIDERPEQEALIYLYECAKTLGLKKFGTVYYRTTESICGTNVFSTDSFWLT